ncbi:high affinity sulphate transporter 1 [Paraburkholderia fungorum]|uniref:High affinity sulphate transporter 1 n=1 Tax=Paraburkholderia fungorum TaxID=134537 RepID=A0A1H1JI87_9BURK|nr:SulP family inorganic anion transporter [Paraburkholderia fungorum]SDR49693.1 high affinity sulphate transporter 1 [Paraburkholderia fungorum]
MANETSNRATGTQSLLIPEWIRHYDRSWARPDLVAGLTAAAVVIPKALAYATVAGLPVQVGLYTAFVPMLIYAFLGTSRPLSVSTTTTLAILVAAGLDQAVPDGNEAGLIAATATLMLMVGAILTLASVLRLGFLANFISEPVLIGFKAGIAVVIVVDQIPKLLGIHFPKGSFVHNLMAIVQGLPHASLLTIVVGALTLVALVGMEHFFPRAPAPLIAVAGAIGSASLFGLATHGVGTVGHVPTGLPALTLPDFALMSDLWPVALGTSLMSFTETIAAGRAFVRDGEPTPGANRELFATGLANLGGSLFGAMPAGGGTTQTAVNRSAGARSQAAECVTAATALGVMLLLAPLIGLIPHATLAAVVIVYSIGLFNPAEFRAILSVRRTELIWALVALAGVVLLGTLEGILVAIVVSLIALAYQVSDPPVHELTRKRGTNVFRPMSAEHSDDESFPGMLILRPEGRIFFANADNVALKFRQRIASNKPRIVVLDLSGVFDIEYTALRMLIEAEKKMRNAGVVLWLAALNPGVLAMVQRSPLAAQLGHERMFYNLEQVIARYDMVTIGEAPDVMPDDL